MTVQKPITAIEIDLIQDADCATLVKKDGEYAGSWKKRGGVGAFFSLARKWDRIEAQLSKDTANCPQWDILGQLVEDTRPEGLIDDVRDLRQYLLLVEAEVARMQANHTSEKLDVSN